MSADSTEQDGSGGEDLRARYLPVSRKELRRRREAELAAQREASESMRRRRASLRANLRRPGSWVRSRLRSRPTSPCPR